MATPQVGIVSEIRTLQPYYNQPNNMNTQENNLEIPDPRDLKRAKAACSDVKFSLSLAELNLKGANARLVKLKSRDKELCLMLENSQIATERFTGMTRWKRIKWALFQK